VLDNCVFYLSREVPRHHFELMIRASGGRCIVQVPGVDLDFAARGVTHYVLDRPVIPEPRVTTCDYVQPQWIPDCINAGILLPIEQYSPGTPLPPHLSPFSDDEKHGYIPERAMEIKKLQNKYNPPTPVVETLTSEQSLQAQEEAYQNELDQELGHKPQYKINPATYSSLTNAVELAESMFKPRQRFMYQKLKRAQERKKKFIKELTRKRTSRTIEAGDEAAHVPAAAPKEKLTTKYPRQPKQPRQN
ncbi:MAG: hypothetical protein Q8P67_17145, partial [archaeon]|nr:hypothetical protein [archaeon]